MKILFGVLGLLLTLVIVGRLAATQLGALSGTGATARPAALATEPAGAEAAAAVPIGPGSSPQSIEQQMRESVERSLQQGRERNDAATQ